MCSRGMWIDINDKHVLIVYYMPGIVPDSFHVPTLFIPISSVQLLSCVSLRPHESQHARPPCPSPTPGVYSNSCLLSQWCHPTISSSVVPFSSCPQSLLASDSFPVSQLFTWGGQSIGASALASVLPKNTQDWSPLERKPSQSLWMHTAHIHTPTNSPHAGRFS